KMNNTALLVEHLKQLQHSLKCINKLWELQGSANSFIDESLSDHYPFETDFNELTAIMVKWSNEAIEKLQ
ncbi:hypothetical protein D7X33_22235, partial [Butyricicoccus sp. 1XD8-22]